ncbi:PSD1 and planctomycete cytochrome C domain-containing protein [Prosthecobacter sp.]|uniref:PSD1 and planctomycete cytochrome C domain-containing protein n=1 Tax=Prosthecobacter sp. TaxID=1965333 RepID=UPI0024898008|nr:PSD1 and planctomycete cytochrome C domain-containing protein [Prosthecobacter sp.]MDI1311444.1 PSD1 and planctomycete cytochrome C domain-containing protein [Prosthecobacter sp.]
MRVLCVLLSLGSALPAAAIDFSRDIQPILSDNCYFCHGPDAKERKGDLRLDVEQEAKAVKDGVAAILPGKSHESTLIERILSTDPDEVMPTPKSNRTLSDAQKQLLKQWIDEGAKWGTHWAFKKIERPKVPDVGEQHPIDAFVRAKLTEKGMKPAPKADAVTLLRRVSLDLTGLPPTEGELKNDYAKTVARLLDSPRFGERWAWDWLDAARYADTNGYQGDPERTMWPWRDWVVKAINENMPYDRFTIWQLGGDLLPDATPEQKLATGFNRNHMINGEGGRIAEETRVENVMDRVETTSTVWLGLTMGCTKCHDHKFDPLTMRDYYGLYDVFNQTSEDGKGRSGQAAPALDISTPAELELVKATTEKVNQVAAELEAFELKKWPRPAGKPLTESDAIKLPGNLPSYIAKTEPKNRGVDPLLEAVNYFKGKDAAYTKHLQKLLAAVRARVSAANAVTKVMVMDTLPKLRETFVLEKGAYDKASTTQVRFNVPASLPAMKPDAPRNRLGLAEWIVNRDNPLTARVTVNRFWQAFFGVGLVKTAEDFGLQGEEPPLRELLDWLASEFIDSGWDVKALLRLIVTSETYQQSSKIADAQIDPENRYLARGPRFRMPSWMLRDQALLVAGLLQDKLGGPAVKPYQPEGIWEEATFGKKSYVQDHGDALYRRTLYIFWRRIVGPTMLFDNAARQTCVIKATRTNTPLQALVTLNDVTYVEAARVLAQRVLLANRGNEDAALVQAFRLVTCRGPTQAEAALLKAQLGKLRQQQSDLPAALLLLAVGESKRDESIPAIEHATWTSLCLMLLNLDEAVTKE